MQSCYKKLFGLGLALILSSCSHIYNTDIIQNRNTDYLKARSIPPLRIPPGLSSSTIHAEYPIADHTYPNEQQEISLIPPGLNTSDNS